jgi:hypothetical protein
METQLLGLGCREKKRNAVVMVYGAADGLDAVQAVTPVYTLTCNEAAAALQAPGDTCKGVRGRHFRHAARACEQRAPPAICGPS